MRHLLVVATQNSHKVTELRALFAGLPVDLVTPVEVLGHDLDVVEDGLTFEANAEKKARAVANATHAMTLADDSGLEVDALQGAPGVRSARYAGERATDADNNAALLTALGAHDPEAAAPKAARFRCVLALVDPYTENGSLHTVEGTCEGSITMSARGTNGFGYDPLFLVAGLDKTMAELNEGEKNELSHRGKASRKMRLVLEKLLAAREEAVRKLEATP